MSSSTPENPKNTASPAPAETPAEVFRPDRGNLLAAILIAMIMVIVIAWRPLYLFWLLIIPALMVYWTLSSRTVVDERGISTKLAFRSGSSATWEEITGVGFARTKALARTTDGESFYLPGITFNSLPKLHEASRGRIPDPITEAEEFADGQIEVVNQEGNKVLMTKEEHAAYLARKQHASHSGATANGRAPEGSSTTEESKE